MTLEQFNYVSTLAHFVSDHVDFSHDVCLFVACQSALESDYGDSMVAQKLHNVFGMKKPSVRPHVPFASDCPGVSTEYASYRDVYSSVMDYLFWCCYNRVSRKQRTNLDSFIRFLVAKGYCPADDYTDRISAVFNSYNSFKSKLKKDESI